MLLESSLTIYIVDRNLHKRCESRTEIYIVNYGLYIIWKIALIIFSTFFQSTSKFSTSELKIKPKWWCSLCFLLWKQATSWALTLFQATKKKQEKKNRKPDFLNSRLPKNNTHISWYVDIVIHCLYEAIIFLCVLLGFCKALWMRK